MTYTELSNVLAKNAYLFPDLESYMFGDACGYNDYLAGLYWDRNWVQAGADPELAGATRYPRMVAKELSAEKEAGCICRRIQLTVENDDCDDCDVQPDAVSILSNFIDTLFHLEQYVVNGKIEWITRERAEVFRSQGFTVEPGEDQGIFPVQLTRRQTISRPTEFKARAEIIVCFDDMVLFDDNIYIPPGLGTNSCPTCPPGDGTDPGSGVPGTGGWPTIAGDCWALIN